MKTISSSLIKIIVLCSFVACNHAENEDFDVEKATLELLKINDQQRISHVLKQADTFSELLSQNHISVNRGHISNSDRKQNQERFKNYFDQVEFIKWDDLRPPLISFSDDGSLAYVIVEKIVLLQFEDDGVLKSDTTVFAWTAIHRKSGDQWEIESIASTDREYTDELAALKNIDALADCNSPQGKYTTEMRGSNTWYFFFYQKFDDRDDPFKCVIHGDTALILSKTDQVIDTLPQVHQAMIQGHNFHMMAYYPDHFFRDIYHSSKKDAYRKLEVRTWDGIDQIGNQVKMHTRVDNGNVVGIEMINPLDSFESIEIFYSDYRWLDNIPLAHKIEIVQAKKDTFTFNFTSMEVNADKLEQLPLGLLLTD